MWVVQSYEELEVSAHMRRASICTVPRVKRLKTTHVQGALPGICTTPSPTNIRAGCAQQHAVFGSDGPKTDVRQPFPRAEERLSYAEHMRALSSDSQASWPWAPPMLARHL